MFLQTGENVKTEAGSLLEIFGESGRIVPLSGRRTEFCRELFERIEKEDDPFRQKLLVLYLLSTISAFAKGKDVETRPVPAYVTEALAYIEKHYGEKILAEDLAKRLHIGRTTLMTAFKKYTGTALNAYLVRYRLKIARELLRQGASVQETAERCGFGDSGSLIRSFKKYFGTTPGKFSPDGGL